MQQTDKYKLNLVEKDDVFSPDALNENMEKVEGALAALQTAVDGKAPASLEGRVAALELKKVVAGTYQGSYSSDNSRWSTIELGFTPIAVLVHGGTSAPCFVAAPITSPVAIDLIEGGFQVRNATHMINMMPYTYSYIAFG